MKLAVTILASILFACSVTTAIPVNPSATTSAEASTSTVTPSAQTTPSIDLSRLSDEDMNLIKEYAKMKKSRDNAKETYDLLQPKALAQKKLLDWLDEEYEQLLRKFQTSEGHSKHSEKLNELEQKLKQERKTLDELEIKQHSSGFLNLNWILDPKFLELVSTFGNSTPSQQPGSEQPSTSGTQNQSKHHKSSSSSSKTSTVSVQPIQTSSSTQAALSSTQRTSRSNSRLFGLWGSPKSSRVYDTPKSKNELKSFLDSPNPNDSDESDDESSV
ncbi:hypothetical protein BDEG_23919 [Batrachochytrium dendrobatidis JEL423]|uniref:Uncharacterized protein n=1 Tax=Batrachochytrium dendrobatidis (strain JEL423) TaxID=403673 RepID=A0A177WK42_BATDL|nr:hypothetical protein BDEG_23919 [Batrachochytrium dendrobatidis JEL423]